MRIEKSSLRMASLSEQQLEDYLDSEAWLGKSGAFGYQYGHPWLTLISGTADNVVGLPMQSLHLMLSNLPAAWQ